MEAFLSLAYQRFAAASGKEELNGSEVVTIEPSFYLSISKFACTGIDGDFSFINFLVSVAKQFHARTVGV